MPCDPAAIGGDAVIHLVTDLLDPAMGSEFQNAQKAVRALMQHGDGQVSLWTCERAGNESRIRAWLQRNGWAARVHLNCLPMPRASPQGHHRHRLDLALDLLHLYRCARVGMASGDTVWKCGQSNFAFYLLFLMVCRADAIGPISGFERPPWRPVANVPLGLGLYYAAYAMVILAAGAVFRALHRRRPGMWMLAATEADRAALKTALPYQTLLISEVSLDDLAVVTGSDAKWNVEAGNSSPALPTVLWAGSLIHRKNPLLALDVMARVLERDATALALMVGSGPLEAPLRRRWAQLPAAVQARICIEPPQPRSEFTRVLARSKVLLVTSLREVNSVLVLEAMAQGLAVVSTAVSGMQRSVGACGELFAPYGKDVVERAAHAVRRALERGPRAEPTAWLRAEADREDRELRQMVQGWHP